MAKSYRAAKAFNVGGDALTYYAEGEAFPAGSEHLAHLVKEGYVVEGKADKDAAPVDPVTGLPPDEAAVYEENQGTVADAQGTEVDVVGHDTPDAEDVEAATPAERAKAAKPKRAAAKRSTTKRATAKRSTAKRSTAK